jgi:starch synthase
MKIAFFASEAAPYAKTGGLADVAGALPRYLSKLGLEVKVFMPLYRDIRRKGIPLLKAADRLPFEWAGREEIFSLWESAEGGGAPVYFIDKPALFDREFLYGTPAGDYPDNGERFAFFSKAGLESLKALNFAPDVLHVHDWQAAIALAYLKHAHASDPFFAGVRSLLTIHNLAYQGTFEPAVLKAIGLPETLFRVEDLEFFGRVSFLKAGILFSDAISTVSFKYSREIQTPEYGCGLDGMLRARSEVIAGILNGIDYAAWNPATDTSIAAVYSPADLKGKAACKTDLLAAFGLPVPKKDIPVMGMVSRLAGQKGLDILIDALPKLVTLGMKIIVLGTGEAAIQAALETAARRYPSYFGLKIAFDEALAHKVVAGSDLFINPARYEPCGLTQMYSLKYGTIPVVRATGGLDDSVQEYDPREGSGTGFKFDRPAADDLIRAVDRAVRAYGHKPTWAKLIQNAMAADFSWSRSAEEYALLYQSLRG